MAIETTNKGYTDSAAYYADPSNVEVPDQTHQEYAKGLNSYILATAIPAGGGGASDAEILDLKQAQGILAIQQAISAGTTVNSNYLYAVDEYTDETGISTSVATYEPSTDSYRTSTSSTHSLLVQSEETGTVTDGNAYFYDSTGNVGEPLTANGNAQTEIPSGVGSDTDPYGGTEPLLLLDGTGDYAEAPDSASWDFGSGDYTISVWVKPANLTGQKSIINQWVTGQRSWLLRSEGSNIAFYYSTNGTNLVSFISGAVMTLNAWQHIAVVKTGGTTTVYRNGTSVVSGADTATYYSSTQKLLIGTFDTGTSDYFNGRIADPRILKGSAEIPPSGGPTSKPTVSTEDFYFDHDITNTTFTDFTGTHTANITNTAVRHTLSTSKFGVSSAYYNGSADLVVADTASPGDWDLGASGTVDTFVRFSSLGSAECLLMTGDETSDHAWKLSKNASNEFVFECSDNATQTSYNTTLTTTSAGLVAGTWHHVRVVVAGASSVIYVDSTSRATGTIGTIDAASNGTIYVGENSGGIEKFTGNLEETSVAKGVERGATEPAAPYATTVVDLELDSITFTAGSAPTKATLVVVMDPIDSVTINTDFIAYVSPTASFANKGTFTLTYAGVDPLSGGNIYTSDDLDISGLTSGTSLRYYIRGANTKDLRVHATYLYYAI